MTINDFLEQNFDLLINDLIVKLESEFSSHDFIKVFAKKFESEYIEFLNIYKGNDAFRTVHSQIAKYLSENEIKLNIGKTHKLRSENIFGEMDEVQGWKKT